MSMKNVIYAFLMRGFEDIRNLIQRSRIRNKLLAINILIFRLVLSIGLSSILIYVFHVSIIYVILIAFIISTLALLFYNPLLEIIADHCQSLILGIRGSITVLFIDVTIALFGLLTKNILIINISFAILILQLGILLIVNDKRFNEPQVDLETDPENVITYLGKIPIGVGLITAVIDLSIIIIYLLQN